jgi:tRNA threonylcarbamoyladenosine biosynthesis protein TsaB
MTEPVVLAFDSSRAACSVAVVVGTAIRAEEGATMARGQAEALLPMIARALAMAEVTAANLAAIAVPVGPGSFTGIRIALSAARGMVLVGGARFIGIDGFRAAVESASAARPSVVAIETGRGDWFARRFARDPGDDTAPAAMGAADIAGLFPAGPFDLVAPPGLVSALALPSDVHTRPADLARLASAAARIASRILADGGRGPDGPGLPPRPHYLAPPAVTMAPQARQ